MTQSIPSALSESQLPHQPMRPERKAARKSGVEAGKAVPAPLAVGPSAVVQAQYGPRGAGPGFEPQEGVEVVYNQYCQQQDSQVGTNGIFMGIYVVLFLGFCGREGPGSVHSQL